MVDKASLAQATATPTSHARSFKNSACNRNHDYSLRPKLPYGFTHIRIENVVLDDRAIEIESQH
jgi:hypothetical protein